MSLDANAFRPLILTLKVIQGSISLFFFLNNREGNRNLIQLMKVNIYLRIKHLDI